MSRGFRLDPPSHSWFDVVFCLTPSPPPEVPRGLCTAPNEIQSFKQKTHPLKALAWSVFGLNEQISLEDF